MLERKRWFGNYEKVSSVKRTTWSSSSSRSSIPPPPPMIGLRSKLRGSMPEPPGTLTTCEQIQNRFLEVTPQIYCRFYQRPWKIKNVSIINCLKKRTSAFVRNWHEIIVVRNEILRVLKFAHGSYIRNLGKQKKNYIAKKQSDCAKN